ncbi:CoA-transferase [Burkholderia diffusa]|uniref:CoA-transferase n=1 Tax=Burkholderia diffusa TaxID=488732 RepID=A0AAW3P9V9_9BURK|nr:CoA transferase [Burkholderia diffusa]KWF32826.1 CoA-transferase [Burkholderia diffusa]KWF38750.1 CoA-transferase [Burkholderia diffusa]KWF46795.1 CoA-transferase [Burkholderia diffusa]KWF50635.1 CoA-transferase [Burkholderia diffusa]
MLSLAGIKVLDLTQHLSGPYCTMILGDLGADVIKIEKPLDGDDQRKLGPFVNGESAPFMVINRNKKSVTLNLKHDKGRRLFLDLAKDVDVIVENFRPGIAKSLGIDYDAIRQINPGIVYCSISGYGQTGPARHKGGFDIMAQGMTGMMDMNSVPGQRPTKIPISLHDIGAGLTSLYAILGAYIHKLKTGVGQYIDVSLVESGLALTVAEAASYFTNGVVPKVAGTRNHLSAPYQAYRALDGYVVVGAGNQKLWEKFCNEVVCMPEWIGDGRFASATDRIKHADDLEVLIEGVLRQRETHHWLDAMERAGIPGGRINSYDRALQDPHFLARDMVVEVCHPKAGSMKTIGIPAKMSETPGQIRLPAPMLGQHTEEILTGCLALSGEEIEGLRADRVI